MTTILWRNGSSHEYIEAYQQDNPDSTLNFIIEKDHDKALEHLADFDILVDGSPKEAILNAPNLKHVIVPWVGVQTDLRDFALKRPHFTVHKYRQRLS